MLKGKKEFLQNTNITLMVSTETCLTNSEKIIKLCPQLYLFIFGLFFFLLIGG